MYVDFYGTYIDFFDRLEYIKCFFLLGITVRYVDYGNCDKVNPSQLQVLQNSFCELPCQALTVLMGEVSLNLHA